MRTGWRLSCLGPLLELVTCPSLCERTGLLLAEAFFRQTLGTGSYRSGVAVFVLCELGLLGREVVKLPFCWLGVTSSYCQ